MTVEEYLETPKTVQPQELIYGAVRVAEVFSRPDGPGPEAGSRDQIAVTGAGTDLIPDHLSDTSPVLRDPVRLTGPLRRSPVSPSARAAPRSAGASPRTGVGSDDSPPGRASNSAHV